jgi:hypothetical protein
LEKHIDILQKKPYLSISITQWPDYLDKKQLKMSIPVATLKDSPSPPTKEYPAFGCPTPYAEPLWYSRNVSPHYTDSHRKLRAAIRTYIDEEILPYAFEWESAGQVPDKARETQPPPIDI